MQVGTSKTRYHLYKCPTTVACERRAAISAEKAEKILSDFTRGRLEGLRGTASMDDELDAAERELERATMPATTLSQRWRGWRTSPPARAPSSENYEAGWTRRGSALTTYASPPSRSST